MLAQTVNRGRIIMGRLDRGADLLASLEQICFDENIRLGEIRAIGAVSRARVGYYRQAEQAYSYIEIPGAHEIIGLLGNISLRDGRPFVHAHISLMDEEGKMVGGHLAQGTIVFACEFTITELISAPSDDSFARRHDRNTGLYLWSDGGKR